MSISSKSATLNKKYIFRIITVAFTFFFFYGPIHPAVGYANRCQKLSNFKTKTITTYPPHTSSVICRISAIDLDFCMKAPERMVPTRTYGIHRIVRWHYHKVSQNKLCSFRPCLPKVSVYNQICNLPQQDILRSLKTYALEILLQPAIARFSGSRY